MNEFPDSWQSEMTPSHEQDLPSEIREVKVGDPFQLEGHDLDVLQKIADHHEENTRSSRRERWETLKILDLKGLVNSPSGRIVAKAWSSFLGFAKKITLAEREKTLSEAAVNLAKARHIDAEARQCDAITRKIDAETAREVEATKAAKDERLLKKRLTQAAFEQLEARGLALEMEVDEDGNVIKTFVVKRDELDDVP